MLKKKLEYLTKEYLEVLKTGNKLDRDDFILYTTLVKDAFGESEASGFLNLILAHIKPKENGNDQEILFHGLAKAMMEK